MSTKSKNQIIILAGAVILLALILIFTKPFSKPNLVLDSNGMITAESAIEAVKAEDRGLRSYPSDNLPPKRIETKVSGDGWLVGFYTEGSGRPGILNAKCYQVSNAGVVTKTGEYDATENAGAAGINILTCEPLSNDSAPAEAINYFMESVKAKVKADVPGYAQLGLGGETDGFNMLKVYPGLLPSDFTNVIARQGMYSVNADGELVFTGNAASNSGVILKDGMPALLKNIAKRLGLPTTNQGDVDAILSRLLNE